MGVPWLFLSVRTPGARLDHPRLSETVGDPIHAFTGLCTFHARDVRRELGAFFFARNEDYRENT